MNDVGATAMSRNRDDYLAAAEDLVPVLMAADQVNSLDSIGPICDELSRVRLDDLVHAVDLGLGLIRKVALNLLFRYKLVVRAM